VIERAPVATGAPRHIAIIMDGNRRWARTHDIPALEGHRQGIRALERAVDAALRAGVSMLTVYAFSEENWARENTEVLGLFGLAETFARDRATALAARTDYLNLHGEALSDLAEVLALAGKRDEAAAALENALEHYERKGNLVSAQRAQTRLAELQEAAPR